MEVCCFKGVVWRGLVGGWGEGGWGLGGGGGGGGCMESVQSVSQVLYHVNTGVVLHAAL